MDRLLFAHNDLTVTEYDDRWPLADGDRRRYSIKVDGHIVTMDRRQWATLAEFFSADCSTECEGPRLDKQIPDGWLWNT